MKPVKFLVLFTICTTFFTTTKSQIKIPSIGNSVSGDLEKIVKDYFNHFVNIRGEEVDQKPQSTDYESSIKLQGAEECSITKYSSANNDSWSWQAVMLTTEEFDAAKKKFKTLYSQVNNLAVHFENLSACSFKGEYESPTEGKGFFTVVFSPQTKDDHLKPLKIELIMEHKLMEWEIKLLVYGKEREDNERGNTKEGTN